MAIETYWDVRSANLTRGDAHSVKCPECGALPLMKCVGKRNPRNIRVSPHLDRYRAAERLRRHQRDRT